MVQEEYGLKSGCKCPDCGNMCHDCMGSAQEPLSPNELAGYFSLAAVPAAELKNDADIIEDEDAHEHMDGWRRYL